MENKKIPRQRWNTHRDNEFMTHTNIHTLPQKTAEACGRQTISGSTTLGRLESNTDTRVKTHLAAKPSNERNAR